MEYGGKFQSPLVEVRMAFPNRARSRNTFLIFSMWGPQERVDKANFNSRAIRIRDRRDEFGWGGSLLFNI